MPEPTYGPVKGIGDSPWMAILGPPDKLTECLTCGAVVINQERHSTWHRQYAEYVGSPESAEVPASMREHPRDVGWDYDGPENTEPCDSYVGSVHLPRSHPCRNCGFGRQEHRQNADVCACGEFDCEACIENTDVPMSDTYGQEQP